MDPNSFEYLEKEECSRVVHAHAPNIRSFQLAYTKEDMDLQKIKEPEQLKCDIGKRSASQ